MDPFRKYINYYYKQLIGQFINNHIFITYFKGDNLLKLPTSELVDLLWNKFDYLRSSRPTAVNLYHAINTIQKRLKEVKIHSKL